MIHTTQAGKDVAAIFVTMNRCEIAEICLEKLRSQTVRLGKVFVINNASTDLTSSMLQKASKASDGWITAIELDENVGNAGGMEIAMEAAFLEGFASTWILDDDSWPEPDALALLLGAKLPADSVRSCRVIDINTGDLSWPLQVPVDGGWQLLEGNDPLPTGDFIQIRRSWLGALIPRAVYEKVGPVEGKLFLRGEDEDYPRRIEQAGYSVFMVTQSLLHHPPAGRMNRWEIGGRIVTLEGGLTGDKLYYRLRNAWWMIRRDRGDFEAAVVAAFYWLALCRWERSFTGWQGVWWEAARDAFQNRLGAKK